MSNSRIRGVRYSTFQHRDREYNKWTERADWWVKAVTLICCKCLKVQLRIQKPAECIHCSAGRGQLMRSSYSRSIVFILIEITRLAAAARTRRTYLASRARAKTPAASGAAAEVPECRSVQFPYRSVVALNNPERENFLSDCGANSRFFIPLQLHIYPPVSLSLLLHSQANQLIPHVSSPSPPSPASLTISLPPLHHWITLFT